MAILQDFRAEIGGIAALANISIEPIINNSKQLPAIVYNSRGLVRESYVADSFGLRETLIQIDVYTEDYTQLNTLRDAVVAHFHGFTGTFNSAAASGGTIVSSCKVVTTREDLDSANPNAYRATIELNILSS